MALFNEVSSDVLAGILAADEENRKRRLMESYNQEKANLDTKYSSNKGGLGGFLGGIVGGIGKGIGDLGTALYDMGGTTIAGLTGGVEGAEKFKKDLYKTDSIKDAYAKSSGTALNAASTLATTILPIGAAGGTVAKALGGTVANAGAGAIGGIADELQQNGENFNAENAANRAISGAAAGLVGGKVGSKIGNASSRIGGALLNNKLATSAVGRGAIAGAVGGATGAGTSAALSGGDIAGSTLQGALGGAMTGAAQGGLMSAGNRLGQRFKNDRGLGTPETATTAVDRLADTTKPLEAGIANDNEGKVITVGESRDKITNKNKLQKIGDELQQNARETKWQGLYENLDRKTAQRAAQTKAPQQLEAMGVTPENYEQYAKTSDYVNQQISKLAKDSGIKVNIPDLVDRMSVDNIDVVMSDTAAKKYNSYINKIIADGSSPSEYSASYLLEKSRELGNKAANLRGNTDDVKTLRAALTDAKYTLRNAATNALEDAGITGDLTTDLIANGLRKMGANEQVADYYSAPNAQGTAPNASDYIRRSSLFEQARDMALDMGTEKFTRNASKGKSNALFQALEYAGLDKPIKTIGQNVVAPIAAKGQDLVGKAVTAVGNYAQQNPVTSAPKAQTTTTTPQPVNTNNLFTSYVARTAGNIQANDNLNELQRTQDYKNLEDLLSANAAAINAEYTPQFQALQPTAQQNQATSQLAQISNGMNQALAAGDLKAYSQLADLYKTAYQIYEAQNPTQKQEKLTEKQVKANAAEEALNTLAQMSPDYGYLVKDVPVLNLVNRGGNKYASAADSLASQLGYMMSGATVTPEEFKRIKEQYIPQSFDSEEQRNYKLNAVRNLIEKYKQGYAEDEK